MIDGLPIGLSGPDTSAPASGTRAATSRSSRPRIVALALLLLVFGIRAPGAHDIIDGEKVNAVLTAVDQAEAGTKAAGAGSDGEAWFALGAALTEAAEILNRDLAAHSGKLTFNGEQLAKSLAQRDLGPRFDETIGRYRAPRTPLEEAVRRSPEAPYAPRARFALLKAGFYESFVLDPFQLVGVGFDDLEREIADAETLTPIIASPDDAEEVAFIHAVDLARAARLAAFPW